MCPLVCHALRHGGIKSGRQAAAYIVAYFLPAMQQSSSFLTYAFLRLRHRRRRSSEPWHMQRTIVTSGAIASVRQPGRSTGRDVAYAKRATGDDAIDDYGAHA